MVRLLGAPSELLKMRLGTDELECTDRDDRNIRRF